MMRSSKLSPKHAQIKPKARSIEVNCTLSTPEVFQDRARTCAHRLKRAEGKVQAAVRIFGKSPRTRPSASESCLSSPTHDVISKTFEERMNPKSLVKGDEEITPNLRDIEDMLQQPTADEFKLSPKQCLFKVPKKSSTRDSSSPFSSDAENSVIRRIKEIHSDSRKSARIIRHARTRLLEIQKKQTMTDADIKEIGERNVVLLREMERFDRLTKSIQKLVGVEVASQYGRNRNECKPRESIPTHETDLPIFQEMSPMHPMVNLQAHNQVPSATVPVEPPRSKSVRCHCKPYKHRNK